MLKLDIIKDVSSYIKKKYPRVKIRVNTNGHANLVYKRNVLPELKGLIDRFSVSLNGENEEVYNIVKKLERNEWKDGRPRPIKIWYPKQRDGLSVSIIDRIYQRSINDIALYPAITNSFIFSTVSFFRIYIFK